MSVKVYIENVYWFTGNGELFAVSSAHADG